MAVIRNGSRRGFQLKTKYLNLPFSLYDVLRIGIGILFIAASYYKIVSPGAFAQQIYNYKVLPTWAINPLAIVLPWVQLFCGIALVTNRIVLGAHVLILAMLLVFQTALASALLRGLNIACGCFKTGGEAATWWTFGRDFLLLLATALSARHSFRSESQKKDIGIPFTGIKWN